MDYSLTTLPSGLKLLVVEMPNLESAALTVWIKVGSRYEPDDKAGISHFLEHMVFKGTKKRPTVQEVSLAIDTMGAVSNAGTSREWTNFYLKSRADLIDKAYDILSDVVLNPLLKQEDLERERGVILEEMAMKEDIPMDKIADIFINQIFQGNSMSRDIEGTEKTVKSINRSDFIRYRDTYYDAEDMLLTVSGGIKQKKVIELTRKYFDNLEAKENKQPEPFISVQDQPRLHVEYKNSEQGHFFIGFPGYSRVHPDRYAEGLLATILGRGMSSRLFNEIREKRGLAYSVGTSASRYSDCGIFATYAGVDVKKSLEAIKVINDQTFGMADGKYPITKDELNKAKEYHKGKTALALEDTLSVNDFFGEMALLGEDVLTPDAVFKKIDAVTLEDVNRVAKDIFNPKKLNLAIIGPYQDKEAFEKLMK